MAVPPVAAPAEMRIAFPALLMEMLGPAERVTRSLSPFKLLTTWPGAMLAEDTALALSWAEPTAPLAILPAETALAANCAEPTAPSAIFALVIAPSGMLAIIA